MLNRNDITDMDCTVLASGLLNSKLPLNNVGAG